MEPDALRLTDLNTNRVMIMPWVGVVLRSAMLTPLKYISWINNGLLAWTLNPGAVGANTAVEISARPIPQEPMVIILITVPSRR